jgi:cation:H+ antiporter
MRDGALSRLDGLLLTVGSVVYTASAYIVSKQERSPLAESEFADAVPKPSRAVWRDAALIVIGLLALVGGARLLVSGAVVIAERFGVSQVIIGLTVVAIGTSLPELATSVIAAIRDEADVAFGNVIGSNILNILLILGVAALIRPFGTGDLKPLDIGMFIGSAVLLLPMMRRGWVLNRWEGGALVLLYVGYLVLTCR